MFKTCLPCLAAICLLLAPARAADHPSTLWAETAAAAMPDMTHVLPGKAASALLGQALAGKWTGTLEYRDFGNDGRVLLPVSVSIGDDSETMHLDFVYEDGPGKTVRSSDSWTLAGDGARFSMEKSAEPMTVSDYRAGAGRDITLIALGSGSENKAAVQLRVVVTRRGDELTISRASQLPGQPWLLRHRYRLQQTK